MALILFGLSLVIVWHMGRRSAERHYARELNTAIASLREEIMADIEAKREERLRQDVELCSWLLRWQQSAHDDINTMAALVNEFREIAGEDPDVN